MCSLPLTNANKYVSMTYISGSAHGIVHHIDSVPVNSFTLQFVLHVFERFER